MRTTQVCPATHVARSSRDGHWVWLYKSIPFESYFPPLRLKYVLSKESSWWLTARRRRYLFLGGDSPLQRSRSPPLGPAPVLPAEAGVQAVARLPQLLPVPLMNVLQTGPGHAQYSSLNGDKWPPLCEMGEVGGPPFDKAENEMITIGFYWLVWLEQLCLLLEVNWTWTQEIKRSAGVTVTAGPLLTRC